MNAVGIIRLILGYVEFEADGGFCDRFINLCTKRGICLWDITRTGETLTASVSVADYKCIRFPARRSGMRVRIKAKRGLPFFIHRNRGRVGLLAGAVLLLTFLMLMTFPVWDIEVTGNKSVPDEVIISVFEGEGVHVGAIKRKIDIEKTERTALSKLPELSWLSLNILGSKAVIEVRETEQGPPMLELDSPCNIVASKDGVVKRAQADIGECVVTEGNPVLTGDLLISGVTANSDGSETLRHAKGVVLAYTVNVFDVAAPPQECRIIAKAGKKYSLCILGVRIPLNLARGTAAYRGSVYLEGGGQVMPLGISWETIFIYEQKEYAFSPEELTLLAIRALAEAEKCELTAVEVSTAKRTIAPDGSAKGVYECVENIASERPILTESDNSE